MLRFPYSERRGNTPGYKGVRPTRGTFTAQVYRGGKRFHLGTYPNEHQAALAANQALGLLFPDMPPRFLTATPGPMIPFTAGGAE